MTVPASTRLQAVVPPEQADRRLDAVLAALWPERSRAAWQDAIAAGQVTLDGQTVRAAHRARQGQRLVAVLPAPAPRVAVVGHLPEILYQDGDLVVFDKPAGLVVHPAPGYTEETLVDALLAGSLITGPTDDDEAAGEETEMDVERPGIVHRLDRDTSGLLVVARHRGAQAHLAAQFKERTVRKRYWALVEGHPQPAAGAIEAPLGRDPRYRARIAVVVGGRPSRTTYRTRESFARHTLLDVGLETGRTHQIRVHLAAVGHPVAGDPLYGVRPPTIPLGRQFLHAYHLELDSPSSGERLVFDRALPPDLRAILHDLRATSPGM
ncbi:MAG: RluA family pseudouridine synthase [Chloroflexota bacterium]